MDRVVIRPQRRADIPGVVALRRRIWPDLVATPASVAWDVEHPDPDEHVRRWVATVDRRLVGSATAYRAAWTSAPLAMVYVAVLPEWRRRGIGGGLFERAARHAGVLGAAEAMASADLGDEPSERFLAVRGFRRTREVRNWALDPSAVALGELPALRARVEAGGLRLASARGLLDRPEALFRLHDAVGRDVPSDTPIETSYATWRREAIDTPLFDPDASFVVVDGESPVAMAWLYVDREGGRAGHGLTGTLRPYRHRGLARLVKLASLQWLAEHGVSVVYTDNDTTNVEMLALNEHLGYRPMAGIGLWARPLPIPR